jgi:uncharacterized protein (TIGR02099 family)
VTTHFRRRLRIARRGAWYVLAIGLVLMALVSGVVSQLLPLAERHPDHVAAWLSARAGRPVTFDKLETQWTRRGPLLRLDGMRVGVGRQSVLIGDAEMLISQYAGLLPGQSFTELRIRGLDLTLEQDPDGRWRVRGLPGQKQTGGDPFDVFQGLGELQVIGAKLAIIAPDLAIDTRVSRVDARLRVDEERVRIGALVWAKSGQAPVEAVGDFDRTRGDGRLYVAAMHADLSVWSTLLHAAGMTLEGGRGRAQAWAELRAHRIVAVTMDANMDQLLLRGAPLPMASATAMKGQAPASVTTQTAPIARGMFTHLQARARWTVVPGGWRIDAPTLRIDNGDQAQMLDGLVVAGGRRYGVLADHIDAAPLFSMLALSDRVSPGLRRWLLATHPRATLRKVMISGVVAGPMRASGIVDRFGFQATGSAPGIRDVSGELDGDDRGFDFNFSPAHPLRIDWPRSFSAVHVASMQGHLAGWREDDGWRIGMAGLRINDGDVGATLRGGLWLKSDGSSPRIDVAVQLDDMLLTSAKRFWVHSMMAPATVQWLDRTLVAGWLRDGHVLISGDLDDWPFAAASSHDVAQAATSSDAIATGTTGIFKGTARITNAVLKFDPGWPPIDHVDADIDFLDNGFTVGGKGVLAGVGVRRFDAGIANFAKSTLMVRAQGGGDAGQLLQLLKQSPLHKSDGETLDNIQAGGLAAVDFNLELPLHDGGGASHLGGTVTLAGATLAEKRWNLAFSNVRGRADYGNGGFAADKLAVLHAGQPGLLSLRVGTYVHDPLQAFEGDLDASLTAENLLQRAPQLEWLKPYLAGRSTWTVAIAIPKGTSAATAMPTRLQLRSNLVGTALNLPMPLHKAASVALPATIDTALPMGSGETRIALGNMLGLRARSDARNIGVRIVLGNSNVADPPPAVGLVASGHATTLDALGWIALVKAAFVKPASSSSGKSTGSSPMPLRSIDLMADRLLLFNSGFPNTRVQVTPVAGGTAVQVSGDALAGVVRIPDADGAAIAGQFERVHWRNAPLGATNTLDVNPANIINPVSVPPLSFDVADLRFNDANLGSARLRTRRITDGLHVDQLQTRTPTQQITISGDWTGHASTARTRLAIALDSSDFGALLDGFGYAGQLAGGHGKAIFNATWPGDPSGLRMDTVTGTLSLAARNGQLVTLDPGAGRVLGLLSLAQLPRRLSLDFHDFFSKGFAFNSIDGDIHIGAGLARSDNLVIDGPAAEIRIRGAANLVAQQFDQTVEVLPKAGNLLTAVGAIAGGPIGAAIGAAANAVLKKPLGRLAAKTYRVTGPWKQPKVETISREQSRINATSPPPSG